MLFPISLSISLLPLLTIAHPGQPHIPLPGPDGKYELKAPGISAKFIPYAASCTNLYVTDRNGVQRDIILGYDNASLYPVDPNHPDYAAVPGRYTNRIKDATYVLDGTRYYTERNDGNGTLHSGLNGWSRRTWNVSAVSESSITFTIRDEGNSSIGFPGLVLGTVTHTLGNSSWSTKIKATAETHKTPIMLTTHPYWNLDAFSNPKTDLVLNHTLHLPYGKRTIGYDGNTESDGTLPQVKPGSIDDFWSKPKQLGADSGSKEWVGHCGSNGGCSGYNGQWIVDRDEKESWKKSPVATLQSDWTGIQWDLYSDQAGVVVYTCYWMGGKLFP
jgi:aldose 1-epimerase